ncbi:Bug family tripartite tricarboxylate transporter substrate binding protein [Achromobacter aloeverae]|uniref:Bug family tripartite tricarboxylate transporter substrate binding protein n=1 Tax=Achromobacter aloeverae TaxID=1750518 RepID=UPI0013010625|nr:tripartite tricarboxylate transporter substrate binding protein [Achromobacter aloeverae]
MGLLVVAGSAFPLAALSSDEVIEVYPTRPITLVVGFSPGDSPDVVSRHLAAYMTEDLGQKVVVVNRPGAGGNIGAAAVAKAAADGYTVYMAVRPVALHKAMYKQVKYDFAKDLVPVGMAVSVPYVLVMGKHVPATTFLEAVELVGRSPEKYACASGGLATTTHFLCEALREKAPLPWTHVPYPGSVAALVDVLGGRADFAVATMTAALPHISSGTVRPLAVFSEGRVPAVSAVPHIEEFGFTGMESHGWCALMAPAGTPMHVITRLNRSMNAALSNAAVQEKLIRFGYGMPKKNNTPEALEQFLAEDTERWTGVLEQRQLTGLQ